MLNVFVIVVLLCYQTLAFSSRLFILSLSDLPLGVFVSSAGVGVSGSSLVSGGTSGSSTSSLVIGSTKWYREKRG